MRSISSHPASTMRVLVLSAIFACAAAAPSYLAQVPLQPLVAQAVHVPAISAVPAVPVSADDLQAAAINAQVKAEDHARSIADKARELAEQAVENQQEGIIEGTDLAKERSEEAFWAAEDQKWQAIDAAQTAQAAIGGALASNDALRAGFAYTPGVAPGVANLAAYTPGVAPGVANLAGYTPRVAPGVANLVESTPGVAPGVANLAAYTPGVAPGVANLAAYTPGVAPGVANLAAYTPGVAPGVANLAGYTPRVAPGVANLVESTPGVAPGVANLAAYTPGVAPGVANLEAVAAPQAAVASYKTNDASANAQPTEANSESGVKSAVAESDYAGKPQEAAPVDNKGSDDINAPSVKSADMKSAEVKSVVAESAEVQAQPADQVAQESPEAKKVEFQAFNSVVHPVPVGVAPFSYQSIVPNAAYAQIGLRSLPVGAVAAFPHYQTPFYTPTVFKTIY
ncbi:pupal cuticle protein PCP52-like isoform X1 [Colias croceus]|uniref:pupal cuticle protein PCP52-like isoform X1 n=1 Tax=Colias crocea TaxID=72248 RepID=UPI001E27EB4E|nr:pupal cuticle protein PCP52-like isoform X1 [Colias croceus]